MKVAIVAAGVAIPHARIAKKTIIEATGKGGANGELAVANHDEDALTLMVEAALQAAGDGLCGIDLVITATTTLPFGEKSLAALLVEACDGPNSIATLDLAGSRRAGLEALAVAEMALRAGTAKRVLVCVAEVRAVAPGSAAEARATDGGCAWVVSFDSPQGALAIIEGWGHAHAQTWDSWRCVGQPSQTDESKAAREIGLERPLALALSRAPLEPQRISRFTVAATDSRAAATVAKKAGILATAIVPDEGDAGAASAPLLLTRALVSAKSGETIAAAAVGDGASVVVLTTGEKAGAFSLAAVRPRAISYAQMLFLRRVIGEPPPTPEVGSALLAAEANAIVRLHGSRCESCRVVSYPPAKRCVSCAGAKLKEVRLARRGQIFTFTRDHLFQAVDPITCMAVVDLEGGGRVYVQVTDATPDTVEIGNPVELVFRRIHDHSYSWKCRDRLPLGKGLESPENST